MDSEENWVNHEILTRDVELAATAGAAATVEDEVEVVTTVSGPVSAIAAALALTSRR